MQRFNPNYYYRVMYEDESLHAPYLKFTTEAKLLLARYYQEKYGISFSFHHNFIDFEKDLPAFLEKESKKEDFRHVFFIGKTGSHAMGIIYLSDKSGKGFLCADSLGSQVGRLFYQGHITETQGSSKLAADVLKRHTPYPVYVVSPQRQADGYSCDTDVFVLARDCCGKREGNYLVPNLLADLKSNAFQKDGYWEV